MKSLLIVLPLALLVSAPASATESATHHVTATSSGRSVGHDAREAWFRHSIGDILEGRAATTPGQQGRH